MKTHNKGIFKLSFRYCLLFLLFLSFSAERYIVVAQANVGFTFEQIITLEAVMSHAKGLTSNPSWVYSAVDGLPSSVLASQEVGQIEFSLYRKALSEGYQLLERIDREVLAVLSSDENIGMIAQELHTDGFERALDERLRRRADYQSLKRKRLRRTRTLYEEGFRVASTAEETVASGGSARKISNALQRVLSSTRPVLNYLVEAAPYAAVLMALYGFENCYDSKRKSGEWSGAYWYHFKLTFDCAEKEILPESNKARASSNIEGAMYDLVAKNQLCYPASKDNKTQQFCPAEDVVVPLLEKNPFIAMNIIRLTKGGPGISEETKNRALLFAKKSWSQNFVE